MFLSRGDVLKTNLSTKKIIIILIILNFILCALLVKTLFTNHLYRRQLKSVSEFAGSLQAVNDFRLEGYKILQMIPESEGIEFMGEMNESFEIWQWPSSCFDSIGKFSAEIYLKSYNSKMQYLYKNSQSRNAK